MDSSGLIDALKTIGGALGSLQSTCTMIEQMVNVLSSSLEAIGKAEVDIDGALKATFVRAVKDYEFSGKGFINYVKHVLEQWNELKPFSSKDIKSADELKSLLRQFNGLKAAFAELSKMYLQLKEHSASVLKTAEELYSKIKTSMNTTASEAEKKKMLLATGVVMALFGGTVVAVTAVSDDVKNKKVELSAGALGLVGGATLSFTAYNRKQRLDELHQQLRGHLDKVDRTIEIVQKRADQIGEASTDFNLLQFKIKQAIEEAEAQMEKMKSQQVAMEKASN